MRHWCFHGCRHLSALGGIPDSWTQPPTPAQLNSLCLESVAIARSWGWQEADISLQSVMTHAQATSNRDGRVMHDNYGPMIWGGTGDRWDLLQLEKNGPGMAASSCASASAPSCAVISHLRLPRPRLPRPWSSRARL